MNGVNSVFMVNIDEILSLLDCRRPEEEQEMGLAWADEVKSIGAFLRPRGETGGMETWRNCARVLKRKTDKELSPYIIELFEWLRDMSWEGAYLIYDRLLEMEPGMFEEGYTACLFVADRTGEKEWKDTLLMFAADRAKRTAREMGREERTIENIKGEMLSGEKKSE